MDSTKFTTTKFVQGEQELALCANLPQFMNYTHLVDDIYEVQLAKKTTICNLPIQLGFFILAIAKRRMLEFKYDFLDVYVDRQFYSILEMDTGKCLWQVREDVIFVSMDRFTFYKLSNVM